MTTPRPSRRAVLGAPFATPFTLYDLPRDALPYVAYRMSSTGVAGSHQAAARMGDTVHVRTRATFDGVEYLELSSGPDADYCCCAPQSGSADMPPAPHRRTSQEV